MGVYIGGRGLSTGGFNCLILDCGILHIEVLTFIGNIPKMVRAFFNSALMLLLVAGILTPKVSAVAVELMPHAQGVVICTGTELIVLRIGPDGAPLEAPQIATDNCTMCETLVDLRSPKQFWERLARDYQFRFAVKLHQLVNLDLMALSLPTRAPPEVI